MSNTYGEAWVEDRLKMEDKYGFHGDDTWRYDFAHGDRILCAVWLDFSRCKDVIKNEISEVFLCVECLDEYNTFCVWVEYELKNNDLVESSEDDLL